MQLIYFLVGVNSVKWKQDGQMIASASHDQKIKETEISTGKVIFEGETADGSKFSFWLCDT